MQWSLWNLERHFGESTGVEVAWFWQGFWYPFRCLQLCNQKSPNAGWKAGCIQKQNVEWNRTKATNSWKGNVRHDTLFQDLGPLHRLQRCGGVDQQFHLEILHNSTKVVIKTSEMARHISLVQCGHSTLARKKQCGDQCAKSKTPT